MLANWMDALDLVPAMLFANSVGCQIAVHLVVSRPKRVERLVLIGPTFDPRPGTMPAYSVDGYRAAVMTRSACSHSRSGPAPTRQARLLSVLCEALHDRIKGPAPRIQMPTLFVRGELDEVVRQEWAEEVATAPRRASRDNARSRTRGQLARPNKWARIVLPFLLGTRPGFPTEAPRAAPESRVRSVSVPATDAAHPGPARRRTARRAAPPLGPAESRWRRARG